MSLCSFPLHTVPFSSSAIYTHVSQQHGCVAGWNEVQVPSAMHMLHPESCVFGTVFFLLYVTINLWSDKVKAEREEHHSWSQMEAGQLWTSLSFALTNLYNLSNVDKHGFLL